MWSSGDGDVCLQPGIDAKTSVPSLLDCALVDEDVRNEQISTQFQALFVFKKTDRVPEMSNEWSLLCLALGDRGDGVIQVVNTRLGDVGLDKRKTG